jgi:hypothetical protein
VDCKVNSVAQSKVDCKVNSEVEFSVLWQRHFVGRERGRAPWPE